MRCARGSRAQVLKKLKQLVKKYPLRYGDLLRLAVGRFSLSSDLPPYVEDFMGWVMAYRCGGWGARHEGPAGQ